MRENDSVRRENKFQKCCMKNYEVGEENLRPLRQATRRRYKEKKLDFECGRRNMWGG